MRKSATTTGSPEGQLAEMRARLEALARDNERLAAENAALAAEAAGSARKMAELQGQMRRLVEQIKLANMRFFGSRSEAVAPDQISLFNEVEAAEPAAEPAPADSPARPRRRGGKRRVDTSKLEHVYVDHGIDGPRCPQCGSEMAEMKVEEREVVKMVPAHLVVEVHRRHVYRCAGCCAANAAGEDAASQIVRAPMPQPSPIPGSFASPSLVAWVLDAKYSMSMPLYRLEGALSQLGIEVSRQDMANWCVNVHVRWLSRVHARMKERLLEGRCIHADETRVQVLREPGREAKSMSRMWLFRSGARDVPNCVYEYHPTRSGRVARDFLAGWGGYLVTDGYAPYFTINDHRGPGEPRVVNVACLVHVRRKFAEIVKAAGGDARCEGADSVALEARRRIDRMFRVDRAFDEMDAEGRRAARLRELKPLMESFREWAEGQVSRAAPRLALHGALSYALEMWPYVENALLDGDLELDNNIAERAIKPFVIGRKNWLFSDTPRGAEASAAIYSVVVTARLNGLRTFRYLEWLLAEMPNDAELDEPGRVDRYLPWSPEVPESCRLPREEAAEAAEMRDEPIVDPGTAGELERLEEELETGLEND